MNSKLRYAPLVSGFVILMSWLPLIVNVLQQLDWQITLCSRATLLILLSFSLWSFSCTYIIGYSFRKASHNPSSFSLVPLHLALLTHLTLFLMSDVLLVGLNYYNLRAVIPLMVFFGSKLAPAKLNFKQLHRGLVYSATLILWVLNTVSPFIQIFPWHPERFVGLEYVVFAIAFFEVLHRKLGDAIESFAYTLMLLLVVGFTYELPVGYSKLIIFSLSYPLIIRSSIIILFPVCFKLGVRTFLKPTTLITLFCLGSFCVFFHFNPHFHAGVHAPWLPRLPTFFFWLVATLNMGSTPSSNWTLENSQ